MRRRDEKSLGLVRFFFDRAKPGAIGPRVTIETYPVAGASTPETDLRRGTFRTHAYDTVRDRPLCSSVKLESLLFDLNWDGEGCTDRAPTCPVCLRRDPRFSHKGETNMANSSKTPKAQATETATNGMSWDDEVFSEETLAKALAVVAKASTAADKGALLAPYQAKVDAAKKALAEAEASLKSVSLLLGVEVAADDEEAEDEPSAPKAPKAAKAKPAAKKAAKGNASKGDATAAEIKKVLGAVGKKGMMLAELRTALDGKKFATALHTIDYKIISGPESKGMARRVRLGE